MRKALVVVALSLMACGPVGGDTCPAADEGKFACNGTKTFLICERGQFIAFPCPGGCEVRPGPWVQCSFAGAKEGDPCPGPTYAVCDNTRSLMACTNGAWKAQPCATSCTTSADNVSECR